MWARLSFLKSNYTILNTDLLSQILTFHRFTRKLKSCLPVCWNIFLSSAKWIFCSWNLAEELWIHISSCLKRLLKIFLCKEVSYRSMPKGTWKELQRQCQSWWGCRLLDFWELIVRHWNQRLFLPMQHFAQIILNGWWGCSHAKVDMACTKSSKNRRFLVVTTKPSSWKLSICQYLKMWRSNSSFISL